MRAIVALLQVDPSVVHLYDVATIEATTEPDVVRITCLVEKPSAETASSNFATIGRYVLRPDIFDILEHTPAGQGRGDSTDGCHTNPRS